MTTKTCTKCKETKVTTEFYKNKQAKDGLRNECKACRYAALVKWREANPEKHRRITKTHNKKARTSMTVAERCNQDTILNARRRSELSSEDLYGGLTFTQAKAMTLCFTEERLRLEAETGVAHHIDHIIPLSAGGTHTKDNIQILTAQENIAKGASE